MELRHLRAFVTVVDAGGVGRAMARLNLSQPALSRQIRALETALGVQLFDRIGRRVQLTSEGEDLLRRSRRLLTDAESLGERARSLKSGHTGVVRIGAAPQAIETVLAGFLTLYRRRHPGVEVHFLEEGGASLPDRLERGEVQLAIMAAGDERFEWRLLAPLYVLAVVEATHRLGRRSVLDLEELADAPLLLTRRGFGSRLWFDAACQVAHLRPHVLLESGAPHTLIALARAGYGVAIVPSNAQLPRGGVRAVPIVHRGAPVGRWASIAWDPRRFLPPYAERFVEELVVYSRRAFPGREFSRRLPPLPEPKSPSSSARRG
jgi:LysR family transcriptional regulator, cyn operon transcriptional activator